MKPVQIFLLHSVDSAEYHQSFLWRYSEVLICMDMFLANTVSPHWLSIVSYPKRTGEIIVEPNFFLLL